MSRKRDNLYNCWRVVPIRLKFAHNFVLRFWAQFWVEIKVDICAESGLNKNKTGGGNSDNRLVDMLMDGERLFDQAWKDEEQILIYNSWQG